MLYAGFMNRNREDKNVAQKLQQDEGFPASSVG